MHNSSSNPSLQYVDNFVVLYLVRCAITNVDHLAGTRPVMRQAWCDANMNNIARQSRVMQVQ